MIKKLAVLASTLLSGPALCFPAKDASYYCTAMATGGLSFNVMTKQWESTRFKPEKQFVLKLRFITQRQQKDVFGQQETVGDFEVTLTEAGKSDANPCYDFRTFETITDIGKNNWLLCTSNLSEYRFDLNTNRYLSAYLQGYVDGKDTNSDTPSVTAGVCTKIN